MSWRLVGDHYMAHDIGIVPFRWLRFEACRYGAKEKESFNRGSSVLRTRCKITISGDDILAGLLIAAPFAIIFTIPLLPFLIL